MIGGLEKALGPPVPLDRETCESSFGDGLNEPNQGSRKDCVDTMVCGGSAANHEGLALGKGGETWLRERCEGNTESVVTCPMAIQAAQEGDAVAPGILERVAVLLGRLCANIVLTSQPGKIVIVGGLAERCEMVLPTLNRTMREDCWLLFRGLTTCEVVGSSLGDTAGVWGAISKAGKMMAREAK